MRSNETSTVQLRAVLVSNFSYNFEGEPSPVVRAVPLFYYTRALKREQIYSGSNTPRLELTEGSRVDIFRTWKFHSLQLQYWTNASVYNTPCIQVPR